jgi:hypothetical protein
VHVARWFSPLPYVFARMKLSQCDDGVQFHCVSADRQGDVNFAAHYTPASKVYAARRDPLSEWLLERYRLYVGDWSGGLIRNEVHHDPWDVQDVVLKICSNTLGQAIGLDLPPTPDRAHFSSGVDALAWSFEPELTNSKIEVGNPKSKISATDGHGSNTDEGTSKSRTACPCFIHVPSVAQGLSISKLGFHVFGLARRTTG